MSMLLLLLLFLFIFTDYLQAEEIKGTRGKNVTIRFTFEGKLNHSFTLKHANLYKNFSKIEEANKITTDNRRNFTLISHEPVLYISNLRSTDAGEYYVSLHFKEPPGELIESRRTILKVHVEDHITVSPPTSNHTGTVPSKTTSSGSLVFIIIAIVIIIMILSSVLLGWQCLMHDKSTDDQLHHQQQRMQGASAKRQAEQRGASSVEYIVLDIYRRPGGKSSPAPQPQDRVEYSSVDFFQRPHGTGTAPPPVRRL